MRVTRDQIDQVMNELKVIKQSVARLERSLTPEASDCYLSQREGAEALGVSRHTLMRWEIPSVVSGRTRMYSWDDLSDGYFKRKGNRPDKQKEKEVATSEDNGSLG